MGTIDLAGGRPPPVGARSDGHEGVQVGLWATAAVDPDDVGPGFSEAGDDLGRVGPVGQAEILTERDRRDDRDISGGGSSLGDGDQQVAKVGECLEDEQVDATFEEAVDGFPEGGADLGVGKAQEVSGRDAERADRATDQHVPAADIASLPGDLGATPGDPAGIASEAERLQADTVRAERGGLDDVRAGVDVLAMDRTDELGPGPHEVIERRPLRHASRVQQRAHRPVGEERTLCQPVMEPAPVSHARRVPARRPGHGPASCARCGRRVGFLPQLKSTYQEWWRDRPDEATTTYRRDAGKVPNPGRSPLRDKGAPFRGPSDRRKGLSVSRVRSVLDASVQEPYRDADRDPRPQPTAPSACRAPGDGGRERPRSDRRPGLPELRIAAGARTVVRLSGLLRPARGRLRHRGRRGDADTRRCRGRPPGIWRYLELLPVDGRPTRGLAVGSTPLLEAIRLGPVLGIERLLLKDDTRNPSLSFKDRAVAIAAERAAEWGLPALACASTGNLAGATAAAAAALGIPAYVFIPADLEPAKVDHALAYGATVVPIDGTYDDVNRLCLEVADETGWGFVNINLRPFYAEGSKTLAFEIAEQLGWRTPDVVVAPIASGAMFTKLAKGFDELASIGLIERRPVRFVGGQAAGCAPVATAWAAGTDVIEPVRTPDTIVRSLAIGNPADGRYAVELALESGGSIEAIPDTVTAAAIRDVARLEGIYPETAGGVTLAAAAAAVARGVIRPGDEVVALLTGNGLKTPDARSWDSSQAPSPAVGRDQANPGSRRRSGRPSRHSRHGSRMQEPHHERGPHPARAPDRYRWGEAGPRRRSDGRRGHRRPGRGLPIARATAAGPRWRAQPIRQRLPQRRGHPPPRGPRHADRGP